MSNASRAARRLVVTADDVGLHPGITDGALRAHDLGVVTACSVVAGGPDIERAADELRARSGLDAGLHLALTGVPPVSPPATVPSLTPGGRPIPHYRAFLLRLILGRIDLRDVAREARAQVARARRLGLRLTHIDGHQHLHVAPGVAEVVIAVAREAGIPRIRIPREPVRPTGMRAAAVWGLGLLAARAARGAAAAGLDANDLAIGVRESGHLTYERIVAALLGTRGLTELVAHPGVGNDAIGRDLAWGYDWDGERQALCRPELREEIARQGIVLARAGGA